MSRLSLHTSPFSYMDEDNIQHLLKCSWCRRPYVEPVSNNTDKIYCRRCLVDVARDLASHRNADTDKALARLKEYKPVTEPLILAMLNQLLVRCTKCGQENIQRGQLKEHEEIDCLRANVHCTAAALKCNWTGLRENLAEHSSQCRFERLRPIFEYLFDEQNQLRTRITQLEQNTN